MMISLKRDDRTIVVTFHRRIEGMRILTSYMFCPFSTSLYYGCSVPVRRHGRKNLQRPHAYGRCYAQVIDTHKTRTAVEATHDSVQFLAHALYLVFMDAKNRPVDTLIMHMTGVQGP